MDGHFRIPQTYGATIISCGAGEDISFDLLFSLKYRARVIIVDPTPRAALHVKKVIETIKEASGLNALDSIKLYGFEDYSGIDFKKLKFVERAIWNKQEKLKLFAPSNPAHVSHSALDFQNKYARAEII